ncbi:nuclear transport factor 2 family protein [Planomonospora sp. ID67723]|uniref:nuclear transport factor 2 family protein n=1 Tax=Planomonospora sp. ID67723 TaxID=2738134 RepID=UPI0018C4182A|nr:nuclear transport factor 2 family protein [Planomonospora sp. ID67723]MBG0826593.1 nuclear transport factor 2 family protein [Planomonospora sp. ID67723]
MNATTQRYREAGEAKDIDALMSTLAPTVIFRSPLSARAGFAGHAQVRRLFSVALGALRDLRYHADVGDDRTRMLAATARLGHHELEEAALVRLGDDGLIEEVTMWIRPLPALTALMAALGPGLARAAGRPALAAFVGASVRPLAFMTDLGDRTLVPLVTPESG